MSVYRPTYRDEKTEKLKKSKVWWFHFKFAGRRIQESSKSTRKTVAQEAEKNRRLELERAYAGMHSEPAAGRVAPVVEKVKTYSANYTSSHRAKSVVFSTQRLAHVKRLLGSCLPCDLTEDKIQEYIRTRLAEGAAGRTVNMEVGELSRAMKFKWSIAWPNVRKLEENHEVGRALSPDEEKRLLQAAAGDQSPNRNPTLYAFLQIALTTGMRSGEIAGLKWEQIDLEAGVMTVGRKAKTRAGSGRQIPMNADIKAVLEMHASWYADVKRFGEIKPEWFVFPGRKGRPKKGEKRLDPMAPMQSITSSWEKVRTAAKVSCRLHDLRHTAATKMAEAGIPESTMLAIMGHMSRAMLERYSHIRMAAKREAVKSLSLPDLTVKTPNPNEVAKVPAKVKGASAPN
ncbi:MAG: phage integrase family protein [Bryobacterales bacterium]|nr:phage integrase family protein [Bryobacterales bacterium]